MPSQSLEFDADTDSWHVYGYPELQEILADPTRFSSNVSRLMPEEAHNLSGITNPLWAQKQVRLPLIIERLWA